MGIFVEIVMRSPIIDVLNILPEQCSSYGVITKLFIWLVKSPSTRKSG